MTFQEFTGKNVEEAIRTAMREFGAELGELDIEILSQGSRGVLGVGGEEARILAAPRSAVAAADSVRAPAPPAPPPTSVEPGPAPEGDGEADPDDQVAALARLERRPRGRAAGGRGRDRFDRGPRPERRERSPRPPRPDREDRPQREPAPFVPGKPLEELGDAERATLEAAKTVLEEILRLMGLETTVEIVTGRETARLNVSGGELGMLIGRRGEKLASLQYLVNLIIARREISGSRIAIDVENYRGRREDQLRDVADRAAKRVMQTGKIIQLEPMPAIERRIVHMVLLENPKVRTQSVGVDPNRRVVILPATKVD